LGETKTLVLLDGERLANNVTLESGVELNEVNGVNYSHPQHPGGSSDDADLSYGIGSLASDGYNLMVTGNFTVLRRGGLDSVVKLRVWIGRVYQGTSGQ